MTFLTTQTDLETMDAEDFSFFLAYGMTHDDEEEDSLLNVEMYNMLPEVTFPHEEGHCYIYD